MGIVALLVALLFSTATSQAQAQTGHQPVAIFVTSIGAVNGLTDPSKENRDTVKDVVDELAKKKAIVRVVPTQAEATIVLTVLGRERSNILINQGLIGRYLEVYVKAKLTYRENSSELKGTGWADPKAAPSTGSGMKAAAREVANQVVEWVKQNAAALNPPGSTSVR